MAKAALLDVLPAAPGALCAILDPDRGPVLPPLRSEIFGLQRFAEHGRSLGDTHRAESARRWSPTFFPRLRSNVRVLREAHRYIGAQAATGYDISPAAEWLLDNFHLIEAQLKEIHEGLPRSYFRALPVLMDEPLAGLPRIYGVAWAFVAHTDGAFDEDLLVQFLCAYQETRELNLGEMWALPTTLRVLLVENLRRLAERVATNKAAREVANLCCDRIETLPAASFEAVRALLERRGVARVFLAQVAQRLQEMGPAAAAAHEPWLRDALPDRGSLQTQQSADQTADNLSVSNAMTSLRAIGDADWPDIVARTSGLMRLMLSSPTFESEHVVTRDQTLHGVERLARRSRQSELSVARTLLGLMDGQDAQAAVAGHWLQGAGRPALLRALGLPAGLARVQGALASRLALPVYLAALLGGTLALLAWLLAAGAALPLAFTAFSALTLLWAVPMLFPVSETVVAVINRLISESARPQPLPRLALAAGIPPEHRVMVVIPALLTDPAAIQGLAHQLLLHHLANPEQHAQFALLSDWADAREATAPADDGLLAEAVRQVEALNAAHPRTAIGSAAAPRFILLHRARRFSDTERRWIGWERKRGKLEQLVALLAGGPAGDFIDLGELSRCDAGTAYIVTLDSDTQLPPGRLRALVGVAAHPHNQPRLGADGRTVEAGYGILQPRVVTPLPAPGDFTPYHGLFAGQCGIDPYSAASSEVFQDLFGEGTFTGKGLLNVRAMHAVLSARLPEGRVLSHDLLEGAMARCAAVTDITVIEDAPFHADVAASRVHRWTRGDWQLLPFLLGAGQPAPSAVHRWKMFDNLRRSLVPPMSLALLLMSLAGWGLLPGAALALLMAAFSAGPLMGAVAGFAPSRDDIALRHFYRQAGIGALQAVAGGLWHLAQLLSHSLLAVDAIVRALYRMVVSRRHLLQWTTAATAQAQAATSLSVLVRRHWSLPVVALLLYAALRALGTPYPALSGLLCLLWAASPLWTWLVSRPRPAHDHAPLAAADRLYLHDVARDTWRFFERCVGAADHHLPPDNLQRTPHDIVAHRTSPTNIGLYLLGAACARQFGWIGTEELLTRLEATLATLHTLKRHRGHFLNWYDTRTTAPLLPAYVSTVDSGNLGGHLLAVAQACRALARAPHDTEAGSRALQASRRRLAPLLARRHLRVPAERGELLACLADHRAAVRSASLDAASLDGGETPLAAARLVAMADACEALAWEADFAFLHDRRRHLFHIGYRVAEQQLDAGFYDLLASESRLTSLLAVAKGDVPMAHWASLGRPFLPVGAQAGLRSWSGSMFEYLMPCLVLDEPHGSVLREACHAAVREQIAFAEGQGVPWGISESAYAGSDHTLAYQYAPQGVPRLALRRTPTQELVIAPYATALAAMVAPRLACMNLRALEARSARGRYGFIEALDFSPARQVGGGPFTRVDTFMAHHQGMTIVSLANVLMDGVAQRWGMADVHLQSVASLLHERAPREVSLLFAAPAAALPPTPQRRQPGLLREVLPGGAALEPTHLLSNGRYSVTLRANGAGWSRWGATGITRWKDDALRDACGSFFYLRWDRQPAPVSITQHPAPDAAAQYQSTFHADRVCFDAAWPEVQAHTTVWVSPEDDIEFRKVELRNLGDRLLDIELISAFEVTLADPRADEAHPAFTSLFVGAEWHAGTQALMFERRPRLDTETGLKAVHFLTGHSPEVTGVRVQADRQHWLGRNRDVSQPLALFHRAPEAPPGHAAGQGVPLDTGLDPVCALAVRLRIEPHGTARLTFATAASDDAGTLHALVDKYRQPSHVERASLMSATLAGIRLRALGIGAEGFAAMQTLTTALVLNLTRQPVHAAPATDALTETCDRRLLWRFGISGDRPLILVTAGVAQGVGLLRSLAQGLRIWSWGSIACDLVVVNTEPASYQMALQRELQALREQHATTVAADARHGGAALTSFHVLRAEELSAGEMGTLRALARVRLRADGRPLLHHLQAWVERHEQAFEARHRTSTTAAPLAAAGASAVPVPQGAFDAETGDFRFDAGALLRPARPWTNVLSNRGFGAQITESGGGYTWALNSRLNQLTGWSNDAVSDPPSEWFLLQDRRSGQVWSVTPSAWGDDRLTYRVQHGQGDTVIRHRQGDLEVTATWCVDAQTAVKQVRLRLHNHGTRTRHLRLVGMAEWVMGAQRADRATTHTASHRLRPRRSAGPPFTALTCTQRDMAAGFGEGTAFFGLLGAVDGPEGTGGTDDWTCDRRECFDARGRLVLPDHFGQVSGSGLDPCAALSSAFHLEAGGLVERVFLLGHAESPEAARQLAADAASVSAADRLDTVHRHWQHLLGATRVATPDPLFDAMVNGWLLYQTIACRLWAKAGFYQAGGATGFRDQLQDAMALASTAPAMLREQIVLCASRQFPEGDVQHWWHAPTGAGVRTHFSDDLLWLPHAVLHYLQVAGDTALLDEPVAFIEGPAIPPGAEDVYNVPAPGGQHAPVYEHGARAIDRSLRVGEHGLPLMGSGDWNDGMNRVGIEGRGESVWLGWFLCSVVAGYAPLARARGDADRAARWEAAAAGWRAALQGVAWDGQWFKRAFFDDGQALGSRHNAEARIDLIAQAWSVLSDAAPRPLQQAAMAAVEAHLVDREAGLIKLLDPPLAHAVPSAGYIQAYPPGVRENGGQYAHAGVWALMAQAELAQRHPQGPGCAGEQADIPYRYFTFLSPAHRAAHPTHGAAYRIEPYVMAGDVYTHAPRVGQGGWSWYTGSAAWMQRAALGSILGLQQQGHRVAFTPCLPSHWPQAEVTLRRDGRSICFILFPGHALQALAATAPRGARLLRRGAWLDCRTLPPTSCHVVPMREYAAPHQPG